ncbi:PepSY-like domain-containing protein [Fluviicola sp.]|jgi:hypothetical protein|uniref:PepSY-like domain-containing protein n=1 Tax=Fluviicola sp. TaxID=1917219 RepID=UPI002837E7B0|nr:PepSY-like domain-containing protein [Fluviicola sp.]MDR0801898.1 PepSY-like domain-containing protein [Fluviicola sp.]
MKKIIFAGGLVISLAAYSSAQKNEMEKKDCEIPAIVESAFKKHHSDITDVDWEKEGSNYEASFKAGKTETSVVIDPGGQILETETEMKTSTLPKNIQDYIAAHYNGQKIKEAAKIVLGDGSVQYEAEVNKKDLIFDNKGKFIKETGN